MLKFWKNLEKTQYLSESHLLEKQWERLKDIIKYSYHKNSFYKKKYDVSGIHPEDIKNMDDILKIPALTKKEIRENVHGMISNGYNIHQLMKFKTGGSTGKPLELFITEECSEQRNACARRHDRWAGWDVGEPIGAVWGNPVVPSDVISKIRNRLISPTIYLDTMNITDSSIERFSRDWERYKPTLLYGHAHSIYILAESLARLGINTIRPKGILSSSMMLLPHERFIIEDVFGVKVTDRYGCEEVSLIASECERHEGMHLNIEHLYIEFIKDDGRPARSGEMGRIIVTDLMNKAMPFIRYQVEDMGVPSDRKCSCGRGLPLMERIVGRTADFLIRSDGSRVAGISLIENTVTKIPGISQMQIIQQDFQKIQINIVKGSDYTDATRQALENYFHELFGKNICIDLRQTNAIEPEPSGKYRFAICKLNQHP